MNAKFSQNVNDILSYSKEEAIRLGNNYIGIEHLFLGLLREGTGKAIEILKEHKVELSGLKKNIESRIKVSSSEKEKTAKSTIQQNLPLTIEAERVIKLVFLEATDLDDHIIDTEHLLLAILRTDKGIIKEILENYGINYSVIKKNLTGSETESFFEDSLFNPKGKIEGDDDDDDFPSEKKKSFSSSASKSSTTPVLDNFGIDITKAAEENKLDPIVGREKEIQRLSQILSRRKKNNPVLIGEPGVGKSAIVEGLAMRIIKRQVARVLFDKRVITLDLASIVAGTKYRGQFEERMKAILNELSKNDDIILFIDEIHTIVGAGSATGSLDAANMLKPALARGEIQCIGATTLDEYRQYIEKDGALERRFQKVMVDPTTVEETVEILKNIKSHYEDYHNVRYSNASIEACVYLTERYISDRHLPDKAIDALDEAGARVHISKIHIPKKILSLEKELEKIKQQKLLAVKQQDFEKAASFRDSEKKIKENISEEKKKWEENLAINRAKVDEQEVAEVVALMSGVPAQRIAQAEGMRLAKMEEVLRKKVIGQDDAIVKISKAIKRNRVGLKDPKRPIGSFIFLGQTGVGKTYLAKMLAEYLFDSAEALIRVDMSEYMEKFSVSRLIGSPPGYVGYEEGGQLTEKIRRRPYSVVLLDEIEKAHPDIFNLLLQVLDEGHLTDGLGRKIDFKNTIIIMTSNIGTRQLAEYGSGVGFDTTARKSSAEDRSRSILENALRKVFKPEFLNRVDDVVIFNQLVKKDIEKIIDIELKGLYKRTKDLNLTIQLSPAAKAFLIEKGYDQKFGARPLKRAIQKYVEDVLAEYIIDNNIRKEANLFLGYSNKTGTITVKRK
ncbi:MAG: ATP-dependent Clp protease ATP-binding subunit [Candidatus Zixiibacteriota bacterium]|nr:MAG: ATP-dependent Clp protease ATP-binding subunit [candidate division Zixibacteria bacterium]